MSAMKEDIPEFLLEQYALGELSAAERARVGDALSRDASLRGRLEELGRSDAEILAMAPPARMAQAIRRRMMSAEALPGRGASSGVTSFMARRGIGLAAAAAAVLVIGVFALRGPAPAGDGDMTRMKGGAGSMLVYRQSSAGPALLADGQSAAAGDLLQLKYSAGPARFGAIASLDGRGAITWHLPPSKDLESPALNPGGAALPSAYELDDAPAFERFFFFDSDARFNLGGVEAALKALFSSGRPESGAPLLPEGIGFSSILLRKAGSE